LLVGVPSEESEEQEIIVNTIAIGNNALNIFAFIVSRLSFLNKVDVGQTLYLD
jgi:hypothetical protein